MKNINKKGFTLVELLAVLVVLAVIVLLAVNIINSRVKEARKNSVEVNANNYVKAVNGVAAISQNLGEDMEKGTYQVRDLNKSDIKISGEKPRKGYLVIDNYEVSYGCLMYDTYSAIILNGKTSSVEKMNCNDFKLDSEYAYKGSEEVFNVQLTGTYKIEAWGAQGGNANDTYSGGFGAYSVGYVNLKKGDKLYINVGGVGQSACVSTDCNGGYNGGGKGQPYTGDSYNYVTGGGGGTSVASKSGLLVDLTDNDLFIVAGGGAGSYYHSSGGAGYSNNGANGGGYVGVSGETCSYTSSYATGGTQSAGGAAGYRGGAGSRGQGGTYAGGSSGGGGGYYGGGSAAHAGAGGGSGYIGNSKLFNSAMYCYNCTTSNLSTTKTISISCAEDSPTSKCAKKGSGYVKIAFTKDIEPTNDITEFAFTNGEQSLVIAKTGTYKLEVWGAQGGSINSSYYGGYGSYSVGEIHLTKGQKLYINVGGQGTASGSTAVAGGYNGGGVGHGGVCSSYTNRNGASGGGATSIAIKSGVLSSLEKYKGTLNQNNTPSDTSDDYYESSLILIVAGGGGGGFNIDNWLYGPGGAAGGTLGLRGTHNSNGQTTDYATGGTQIAPGAAGDGYTNISTRTPTFFNTVAASFGKGGNTTTWDCLEGGGGGGGFFGGGSGSQTSGGGGSGYIANPSLTNKKMVVYTSSDAFVSNVEAIKTERTTSASATATANYAKTGNGYAKITLLD